MRYLKTFEQYDFEDEDDDEEEEAFSLLGRKLRMKNTFYKDDEFDNEDGLWTIKDVSYYYKDSNDIEITSTLDNPENRSICTNWGKIHISMEDVNILLNNELLYGFLSLEPED